MSSEVDGLRQVTPSASQDNDPTWELDLYGLPLIRRSTMENFMTGVYRI